MTDPNQHERIVRFAEFEVDLRVGVLRRRGQRIRLQEKPFQILALLLEHSGNVVTREELRERLWPADTFVDFDSSVNTALKKLRQALEDPADEPLYIKTVPRKGYRFIAPVAHVEELASTPAAPVQSPSAESSLPSQTKVSNGLISFLSRETRTWVAGAALLAAAIVLIVFAVTRAQPAPAVRAATAPALASTADPAAYDDYLRGLYELNKRSRQGQGKALEYLQRAVEKDPHFAQAYSALAYSYAVAGSWGFLSPSESFPKAEEAARRAIELDESLGEAHVTLGEALHVYDWNWAEAEREYQRALELNPNSAVVHKMYAEYLSHAGKHEEALVEAERAQKLDPLSLIITAQVGLYYVQLDKLEQATQKFREATEIDPRFAPAHYYLGATYHFQKKDALAIQELQLAKTLSDDAPEMSVKLVSAYMGAGRKQEAHQTLLALKHRALLEFVPAMSFAEIYNEMGDTEQTITWLEKAAAEHDYLVMGIRGFSEIKEIGSDPRFQKIMTAIAFPDAPVQLAHAGK